MTVSDAMKVMLTLAGVCPVCNNGMSRFCLERWDRLLPVSGLVPGKVTSRGHQKTTIAMHCSMCHKTVSHNHRRKDCNGPRPDAVLATCHPCRETEIIELDHRGPYPVVVTQHKDHCRYLLDSRFRRTRNAPPSYP